MRTGFTSGRTTALFHWVRNISACNIVLMLTVVAATAAPDPGLVAYYPLNGDAQDSSRNRLDGIVTGATATSDRYGNSSGALLFVNDTDRINCGNPAAFNFTGPFTISAWVNLNGTRQNTYIVAKYDFDFNTFTGSPHSYGLGIAGISTPYGFVGDESGFVEAAANNNPVPGDQWHALAFVYTGTNINLYLDGIQVAIRPALDFPPFVNNVPLTIGGTFSDQVFGGAIDDVRIYNRSLSSDELLAQYQADLPSGPPLSDFLVAYYPLDGDAKDKGGNHLDGAVIGTTAIPDRFGKKDRALQFNGTTDRIDCGNPSQFNFTGDFSLSAWVKLNGPQFNQYVVAKYDPAPGPASPFSYGLGINGNSDPYGFVGGQSGFVDIIGGVPLDDEWHAIAFVYQGANSLRLYLDGELIASRFVQTMQPFINSVPLTIGGTSTGFGFAGGIDDVRLYNKALSNSEIARQFQEDSPRLRIRALRTGLVGYYPLNGDAKDRSGNHFDGTLSGTAPTADRFGKPDGALFFNGSTDRIFCGNPAEFNFTNDFTLNAWIKVDGAQLNQYVVAKYDFDFNTFTGEPNSYGLGINGSTDAYGFIGGDVGFIDLRGGISLNDGNWHFLSLAYNANVSLRLYLDGVLFNARPAGLFPPFENSLPLTIGGTFSNQAFRGAIDAVRIYNRALSDEEIAALYLR